MRNKTMIFMMVAVSWTGCGGSGDSNNGGTTNNGTATNNGTTTNNGTSSNNGENNSNNVTDNNTTTSNNGTTSNNQTTSNNDVETNNQTVPQTRIVAEFDGASFQLPESLAYHDELAFLSFLNGQVVTVDSSGTVSDFGHVAIDPPGSAYALGVTVESGGDVLVAVTVASAESTFPPGVYRIPATGGEASLLVSHPELYIPNDVDVDAAGAIYITADGTIFRHDGVAAGEAEIWSRDALLNSSDGTADAPCGVRTSPFPIGANGIEVEADRVLIGSTESGSVLEIPVNTDGSAGAVTSLVTNTAELCGIDGFVGDSDGSFLATVLGSRVVRISSDGAAIDVLHEGLPLLSPSGIDVGTFDGAHQAIIANPDFGAAFGPNGPASAAPNLTILPL